MAGTNDSPDLPQYARALALVGPKAEAAMRAFLLPTQGTLFDLEAPFPDQDEALHALVRALNDPTGHWTDDQAANLLHGCADWKASGHPLDLKLLTRWIANHPDDAASVLQCLHVLPPDEVEIIRILSRAGSQKVVYLAVWRSMQREIVLKRIIRSDTTPLRDLESFPLNLSHPNVIKTHPLRNRHGELFFAEHRLAQVLDDGWRAAGLHDGANLLYDICAALRYLHDHGRVHGDVKPDNIGREAGEFILLDFGICRPTTEFVHDATATGSLRTRAPELLLENAYIQPTAVDIWALGATVYNSYAGRFPLIDIGEIVPRITHPAERELFERTLRRRVEKEWDRWLDFAPIPEPLRPILSGMLARFATERLTASQVITRATSDLSAFLRGHMNGARGQRFSPLEELEQLAAFLDATRVQLLPRHKINEVTERLRDLQSAFGVSEEARATVNRLLTKLAA